MEDFPNRIKEEDKISMAIPTQTIDIDKDVPQDKKKDNRERSQNKETSQIRNNKNNGIYKPDDWGLY